MASQLSIVAIGEHISALKQLVPTDASIDHILNFKQAKKRFRQGETDLIFIFVSNSVEEDQALKILDYVRKGIGDYKLNVTLVEINDYKIYNKNEIFRAKADDIFSIESEDIDLIKLKIAQLISRTKASKEQLNQSKNQTRLLSSVNQFSQFQTNITDLVVNFSESLAEFCCSSFSVIIKKERNDHLIKKVVNGNLAKFDQLLEEKIDPLFFQLTQKAFDDRIPQVELNIPKEIKSLIEEFTQIELGACLLFPLSVYSNIHSIVLCFIADDQLSNVSIKNVSVMKEASAQLRVLLERRCAESQLKAQYRRLKETLTELQATKEQLVHTEKMATMGQFAAGIAHEINNPLAFVIGNFTSMDEYVTTMLKMLELHDNLVQSIDASHDSKVVEIKGNITQFYEEAEVDFLFDDVKAIVNESRDGLLRVRDIISDLNSFSRKETIEKSDFDLPSLIKETLRLLKYEINPEINIESHYDHVDLIYAHRGFLQQVLTNILRNAAHALAEKLSEGEICKIGLHASIANECLTITVNDNGKGIALKDQKRIFDPFFTTKDVGQGVGLGLSVSKNLLEKMGGSLSLKSQPDKYTEFTISLPYKRPE